MQNDFLALVERVNMFTQAMAVMSFDGEVFAPEGGIEMRAKRAAFFEVEVYKMLTSEEMKGYLDGLAPQLDELDEATRAIYRHTKKSYDSQVKVPQELVQEYAALTTQAQDIWKRARMENDYAKFKPYLQRIIEMNQQMLTYRTDEIPPNGTEYDVLLGDYEDGMTTQIYDKFFGTLKETVVPLIKKVAASKKKIDISFKSQKVDIPTQRKISEFLARKLGYDLSRGFIGEAAHPFMSAFDSTDVRITTRYDETDFLSSLYSVMHEVGHALYEQNVGGDIAGGILGTGASTGMHEGQSRFYENIIGRSLAFWENITDELKTLLPPSFANVTPHMFWEAANESRPSLIRVEADELTYSLHVIIRYEIERAIFAGECDIDNLPAIWNAKYEEYLGITPPDDKDGAMQDIHWSAGYFGYFPTYALGSAYAAQFKHYMQKEMDVDALIRGGDIAQITKWLTDKIHAHGKKYTAETLMKNATGEPLNAVYFAGYLEEKFGDLYGL